MMKKLKCLIATGSSGGHIYPALAVAQALEKQHWKTCQKKSDIEIHFVHSGLPLGQKIFQTFKYPVHEIPIGKGLASGQSFRSKVLTLFSLPKVFLKSFFLIKNLKARVVLGTGGALTGPVLAMAFLMNRKTALWEGNIKMGLTNKLLAPFVSQLFTVFPISLAKRQKKKHALTAYPLIAKPPKNNQDSIKKHSLFKVLILGGSQGSNFINQVVGEAVQKTSWRENLFIYHQTGEKQFDFFKKNYATIKNIEAFPFSFEIEKYYKTCDLIFSRAGSGTIWQTAFYKKALVLIPLNFSAGGHQLQNASWLYSRNCVDMIEEKDFHVQSFKKKLLQLKTNQELRTQLAQSLNQSYNKSPEGAKHIAQWLLSQLLKKT